jgi:hypothetical protein
MSTWVLVLGKHSIDGLVFMNLFEEIATLFCQLQPRSVVGVRCAYILTLPCSKNRASIRYPPVKKKIDHAQLMVILRCEVSAVKMVIFISLSGGPAGNA